MVKLKQLGISRARFAHESVLAENSFEAGIYDETRVFRYVRTHKQFVVQISNDPHNQAVATLHKSLGEEKLRRYWLYHSGSTCFWQGRVARCQATFADTASCWFWIDIAGAILDIPD